MHGAPCRGAPPRPARVSSPTGDTWLTGPSIRYDARSPTAGEGDGVRRSTVSPKGIPGPHDGPTHGGAHGQHHRGVGPLGVARRGPLHRSGGLALTGSLSYLIAVSALAAFAVIPWPVAGLLGLGHVQARDRDHRVVSEIGAGLEGRRMTGDHRSTRAPTTPSRRPGRQSSRRLVEPQSELERRPTRRARSTAARRVSAPSLW